MKAETLEFLIELRKRLIHYLIVLCVFVIGFSFIANTIYHALTLPLLKHFDHTPALIATSVPAPFLVPFKSAIIAAFFVTIPFLLYQLWCFIAPALYQHEKQLLWLTLLLSSILFYAGVLFAYFIVLPLVFQFFIYIAPQGVDVKPDIGLYFSFIMRMFIAFGASFELPILVVVLVSTGICQLDTLKQKRPYVILAAFILGMLLTPPDVVSQLLLAIPMWLLYELGMCLAAYLMRARFHPMIEPVNSRKEHGQKGK